MAHISTLRRLTLVVSAILLALPGAIRSQDAQEPKTYELKINVQKGDQITAENTTNANIEVKIKLPGGGADGAMEMNQEMNGEGKFVSEILEAGEDGSILKERREYKQRRSTQKMSGSMGGDGEPKKETSPLEGSVLELQKGDEDEACKVKVEEGTDELTDAHTKGLQLLWSEVQVLPGKPVAVNETWTIGAEKLRTFIKDLNAAGMDEFPGKFETEGELNCTLEEVSEHDGAQIAKVEIKGEITINAKPGAGGGGDEDGDEEEDPAPKVEAEIVIVLKNVTGSLTFDLTHGVPAGLDFSGDLEMTLTQEMGEMTLEGSGSGDFEASGTYALKRSAD